MFGVSWALRQELPGGTKSRVPTISVVPKRHHKVPHQTMGHELDKDPEAVDRPLVTANGCSSRETCQLTPSGFGPVQLRTRSDMYIVVVLDYLGRWSLRPPSRGLFRKKSQCLDTSFIRNFALRALC